MPTLETINVGLAPNDKKGDPLRDAMQKVILNFSALNIAIQGVLDGKGQANGFASLGADGRLLAAQAPVVYSAALPTTAHNLNTYVIPGTFYQTAVDGATAPNGLNYPVAQVGFLEVVATGTPVLQVYTTRVAGATSQRFWRTRVSSASWSLWKEVSDVAALAAVKTTADAAIPIAQKGSANGVGSLDAGGRSPVTQFPMSVSLTAGTDANTLSSPGLYYNNSDAQATAALNWPEQLAGTLLVEAAVSGNSQVTQTYTTRNGSGGVLRTYKRARFGGGAGVWGLWQQQARFDDAMTHVFLAAATDANTLTADNVFYTWRSGSVVVNGSNWAPVGTNISGGNLEVRWIASDMVIQTATFTVSGAKPRIYQRYGSGTTWQAWRIISAVSSVVWLPTADAGDVYVDGIGWHRWNGSAYESTSLAVLLPTTAHDLDTYLTPGDWYQGAGTSATVANNYPLGALTGFLTVKTFGAATLQEYTNRAATNRKFWRTKTGASSWSVWSEAATTAAAMTRAPLAAATDANTLIADNTYYTWTGSAIPGANFPGYQAAGYMQVFWQAATIISQELTLLVTGGKPLKFARFGNSSTGVWQPWKVTGSFSSVAWMPSSNMGDIYVDGEGWYAWDGSAYKLTRAGMDHGQCRFLYVSTTQCRLVPQNGNGLIINGRQYRIPAAGVNIANTAGVNSIVQYVYAYDSAGTIALEASSTTHALHTDGVRIKSGDPSRTLVGMFIKPTSGEFVFTGPLNYVSSWFNRAPRGVQQYFSATTSSLNEAVQLHSGVSFLGWAGDTFRVSCTGITHATTSSGSYLSLRVNGAGGYGNYGYSVGPGIGQQSVSITVATGQATDNLYTLSPYGFTGSASTAVTFGADLGVLYTG